MQLVSYDKLFGSNLPVVVSVLVFTCEHIVHSLLIAYAADTRNLMQLPVPQSL